MKKREKTASLWLDTPTVHFPRLETSLAVDVCVIGGGISGLSTAYHLMKEGLAVVVLESNRIASGQTGRTTAHLVNALDDRFFELIRLQGEEGARVAAESHSAAIDRIEKIVNTEDIDCDFERLNGYLLLSPQHTADYLEKELIASHRSGLRDVSLVTEIPFISTGRMALKFPRQAQFHPVKYLNGLAHKLTAGGCRIFTYTHVSNVLAITDRKIQVTTKQGHKVEAHSVVVATNVPVNNRVAIHTKQYPYRTYVIGFRSPGSFQKALLWDTADPYHYVRVWNDVLLVGGEDHRTGQADDHLLRFKKLEDWARENLKVVEPRIYSWSGQIIEPADHLAFIGRNPMDHSNVYIVTGDSGNGMTHGTIAGMLIADLIVGRPNHWAHYYRPKRINLKSIAQYFAENVNTAVQYADWIKQTQISDPDEIPYEYGAVVRRGLKRIAVYKDSRGKLHERSAVCPHLGGIVRWNDGEKTWDCPCHGSRFDRHGKVIEGPANSDLARAEDLEKKEDDRAKVTILTQPRPIKEYQVGEG